MSERTLEFLSRPRSVAVIGAFTLRGLVAELAERGPAEARSEAKVRALES
jgi:acyl-CoA synthetase (NDP forming)